MIHHIAINVADYNQSRAFYVDTLGFSVLGEYTFPNGTLRLDCEKNGCRLELFYSKHYLPKPAGTCQGYRHLAFHVENVEQSAAGLNALGISTQPIRQDPMGGGRMTFFYDPDGLELELYE